MGHGYVSTRLLINNLAFLSFRPEAASQHRNTRLPAWRFDFKIGAKADPIVLKSVKGFLSPKLGLCLDSSGSGNDNNNDGNCGRGGHDDHNDNEEDGENNDLDPLYIYRSPQIESDCINKVTKELFCRRYMLCLLSLTTWVIHVYLDPAIAFGITGGKGEPPVDEEVIWEVRGSRWMKLVSDPSKDQFLVDRSSSQMSSKDEVVGAFFKSVSPNVCNLLSQGKDLLMHLMLPEGFPDSVTSDYLNYTLWRGVQGIASQISGVIKFFKPSITMTFWGVKFIIFGFKDSVRD